MRYLPHTNEEIDAMLKVVGRKRLDELFCSVPDVCRYDGEMNLPEPMSEWALTDHASELAEAMKITHKHKVLIGAGSYHHYIPETIPALISRQEFLTAYTPYQAEISQGRLEAILNFQTVVKCWWNRIVFVSEGAAVEDLTPTSYAVWITQQGGCLMAIEL